MKKYVENEIFKKKATVLNRIESIQEGHSQAYKYKIEINGKMYFVKLIPSNKRIFSMYEQLIDFGKTIEELVVPCEMWQNEKFIICLYPWLSRTTSIIDSNNYYVDKEYQYRLGMMVGKALKRMYSKYVEYEYNPIQYSGYVIDGFKRKHLRPEDYNRFDELINNFYSMKNAGVIVHGDIKPGNVLIDYNHNIHIIDFDEMYIGNSLSDMAYCMLLSQNHSGYKKGVCDIIMSEKSYSIEDVKSAVLNELIKFSLVNDTSRVQRKISELYEFIFE